VRGSLQRGGRGLAGELSGEANMIYGFFPFKNEGCLEEIAAFLQLNQKFKLHISICSRLE